MIPILIAGVGAGAFGIAGHMMAKETNERAQEIALEAQTLYNNAKQSLEITQNKTQDALVKLGNAKKEVLDTSMNQFLTTYDKIKNIRVNESVGIQEISKFSIDQQGVLKIYEMKNVYSTFDKVNGAALAVNLASGIVLAGAVSAFVWNAPMLLFTGMRASKNADENLEKANTMYAEAEAAVEKMKISETMCCAITERTEMFDDLLVNLNGMFSECTVLLTKVITKKEKNHFMKKLTSEDFSEDDLKLIAVTRALAGAVKSVIDTPMLSKEGNLTHECEEVYDKTVDKLPDFDRAVQEVNTIDYEVDTILIEDINQKNNIADNTSITDIRSIFAILMGIICATYFSEKLTLIVSTTYDKFLFMNSFTANKIAIWLWISTSVIMLIGKFRKTKVENICCWGSGVSLFILYVQYCRTVELMKHYIIFSIIFLVICAVIFTYFDGKKNKWNFGTFFSGEAIIMMLWPIDFFIYVLFSKWIGFSGSFWLVVTSIFMFVASVFGMPAMTDE